MWRSAVGFIGTRELEHSLYRRMFEPGGELVEIEHRVHR